MWIKITLKEFLEIQLENVEYLKELEDEDNWLDFNDFTWYSVITGCKVLRQTMQANYDEVAEYPPTITYYKWRI